MYAPLQSVSTCWEHPLSVSLMVQRHSASFRDVPVFISQVGGCLQKCGRVTSAGTVEA